MHSSTERDFRESIYSGSGDNCVETADLSAGAAVGDFKTPEKGHFDLNATEGSPS
ncbi:DUF397 domain-containing protein [Streptomonospora alba]|uniref:DUF397 domain-containing protein n=1 Tax=Streptomonospora alba TaxID=183763 RepID=UPI0009FF50EF|nr:DUF397 domain-containing protein [Streptomonospora alba]